MIGYVLRVYWMSRPPYVRWAAAGMILIIGVVNEFRPATTIPVPVARSDLAVGSLVEEEAVAWFDGSPDLFDEISLPIRLGRSVRAGDPITAADFPSEADRAPADWWRIALPVPTATAAGSEVLAVVGSNGGTTTHQGISVSEVLDDGFGSTFALVAFSGADAAAVASGVALNQLTVMVRNPRAR